MSAMSTWKLLLKFLSYPFILSLYLNEYRLFLVLVFVAGIMTFVIFVGKGRFLFIISIILYLYTCHSHNRGGGKSNYCPILEAKEVIYIKFLDLVVASCLAGNKKNGKQLCSPLDESPKWGAFTANLLRSLQMESLKQFDSSFLDGCTSTVNVRCHAFHS